MIILGIDPGLNTTGYGVIEAGPLHLRPLAAGEIRASRTMCVPERLATLHDELSRIIRRLHPDVAVLEMLFTHHRYVTTSSLMAHARGVACLVVREHGLIFMEYPPAQVKKALTGRGAASKEQVARMVANWLGCGIDRLSADATDALALAVAHAHIARTRDHLPLASVRKTQLQRMQSRGLNLKRWSG